MTEFVTLLGAEDVKRASSNMTAAADRMSRAAGQIDAALQNHERFLTEWLVKFDELLEKIR